MTRTRWDGNGCPERHHGVGTVVAWVLLLAAVGCESPHDVRGIAIQGLPDHPVVGESFRLSAVRTDGTVVPDELVTWTSSDEAVASIGADGTVTGSDVGTVTISAFVLEDEAELPIRVNDLIPRFSQIAAGAEHTCALSRIGETYCWGRNDHGQLGIESLQRCESDGTPGSVPCTVVPTLVDAVPQLAQLVAGNRHTCGLTQEGVAYCWGKNERGQLGDGSYTGRSHPAPVDTDRTFARLSVASSHTCGLTTDGVILCWGTNWYGELGEGPTSHSTPWPIHQDLAFETMTTAIDHTCGVLESGETLCWGRNNVGQLGVPLVDGRCVFYGDPIQCSFEPQVAIHDQVMTELVAAAGYTCGLTSAGAAYCWGSNLWGRLGDGTFADRAQPKLVAGGHVFETLTAGTVTACGLHEGGLARCWGRDVGTFGAGRDGPEIPAPALAAPGIRFAQLSAGFEHTCGLDEGGFAWCFGRNWQGQLGNGANGLDQRELLPVGVVGQR